jgi:protein-S-isoprenylcysteine O-methyltransferase Ste14
MPAAAPAGPLGRLLAWLGGAVFVASLVLFAWCYAVRFSRTAPGTSGLLGPLLVNVGLFTVFAVHHSVMARTGAKRWIMRLLPPSLERSAYVWLGSLLFVWTCLAWEEIPGTLYAVAGAAKYACVTVQLVGGWLTLRSAAVIDVLELAGIRQAMGWPVTPTFKIVGPYTVVRHPIYLGWVCITFGTPTMTATKLAFAVISTLYLMLAVPFEERSLVETFGDEYREYQRRVRWRMLPFLY